MKNTCHKQKNLTREIMFVKRWMGAIDDRENGYHNCLHCVTVVWSSITVTGRKKSKPKSKMAVSMGVDEMYGRGDWGCDLNTLCNPCGLNLY